GAEALSIFLPLGRHHDWVVSFTALFWSGARRKRLCTLPLPYVRSPTTAARPLSWRAAATISLALALELFTSTAIGLCAAGRNSVPEACAVLVFVPPRRSLVVTIFPSVRNRSAPSMAWVSS